jgi:monoamine oxidase
MSRSLISRLYQRQGKTFDALSRRDFLRLTLAAGAGLLSQQSVLGRAQAGRPRVVVIGAGLAGLACGYELRGLGYQVTVLEARQRLGGRVLSFSDFIPEKTVEGGGELIGSNHPTWLHYASRFGLSFWDVTEAEDLAAPLILDGQRLSRKAERALWEELDTALSRMNADAAQVHADEPWRGARATAWDRQTLMDWVAKLKISSACRQLLFAQLANDNGVSPERQSYLGNLAMVRGGGLEKYWTESEVYRCRGGNGQLAQRLAHGLGFERIHFHLPVQQVTWREHGAIVQTANGRRWETDHVVLAVPPSVWSKIRFDPGLPHFLKPQMGKAVKYLAEVKSRFWAEKSLSSYSLSNGPIGWTWESTHHQPKGPSFGFTAFSGGPAAEACRLTPPPGRDEFYAAWLTKAYPDFRHQFIKSRFMDWPAETWTAGSYSFPAPGQISTQGPLLKEGLGGRLHFAGEHTCYKFVGYMEGALNSGVTVAKRIAQQDGLITSKKEERGRKN